VFRSPLLRTSRDGAFPGVELQEIRQCLGDTRRRVALILPRLAPSHPRPSCPNSCATSGRVFPAPALFFIPWTIVMRGLCEAHHRQLWRCSTAKRVGATPVMRRRSLGRINASSRRCLLDTGGTPAGSTPGRAPSRECPQREIRTRLLLLVAVADEGAEALVRKRRQRPRWLAASSRPHAAPAARRPRGRGARDNQPRSSVVSCRR